MTYSQVLVELQDGLFTITLNRPERRNALNFELLDQLIRAFRDAQSMDEVRAVLLIGSGGVFSVGGDVQSMADPGASPQLDQAELRESMELSRIIYELRKPTVAAVQKAAAGAGLSLALACDFRVVGETAKITTAFVKVGLSGDYGGSYFMTKLIGSAKARELYMLSPIISGREAADIGLMTRAVPDPEVPQAARSLARTLADGAPIALGYMKQNIANAETLPLQQCLDREAMHHALCSATADHREGASAFMERRQPLFKNS